jgi:tetratricopeptide (TPR) repeat protein
MMTNPWRCLPAIVLILLVLLPAVAAGAEDATTWYARAEDLAGTGDYAAAIDAYQQAVSLNPRYLNAWIRLGYAYQLTGQHDKAVGAYTTAIAVEPNSTIAYTSLGYVYGTMGKNIEALQVLENATTISPDDPYAWLSKGITLSSLSRFNESIAAYKRVISLSPRDSDAWFCLGLDYFSLGNYPDALDAFDKALEIDDRKSAAWNYKGQTLHKLGRYQEAIEAYNRGLIVDPGNSDLAGNKAITEKALRSYVGGDSGPAGGVPGTVLFLAAGVIIACGIGGFIWWRRGRAKKTLPVHSMGSAAAAGGAAAEGSAQPPIPHDVFISYSSRDKPVSDAVCATLEAKGIRCWVAPRDVLPGTNYPRAIVEAIEASRVMVLIFSSHSNASPHVVRELSHAVSKGVIIVPFRIEDIPLSKDMEYLIGIPHWLDAMTQPLGESIAVLAETVSTLLRSAARDSK